MWDRGEAIWCLSTNKYILCIAAIGNPAHSRKFGLRSPSSKAKPETRVNQNDPKMTYLVSLVLTTGSISKRNLFSTLSETIQNFIAHYKSNSGLGTKMAAWDWTSPLGRQLLSRKWREVFNITSNDLFPSQNSFLFFNKRSYNWINLKFLVFLKILLQLVFASCWFIELAILSTQTGNPGLRGHVRPSYLHVIVVDSCIIHVHMLHW